MNRLPSWAHINLWENEILLEPQDVEIGHFVCRLDVPWIETPFPLEGLMVEDGQSRQWLRENCRWAVVDLARSRNQNRPLRAMSRGRDRNHPDHPFNLLRRSPVNRETMQAAIGGYQRLDQTTRRLIGAIAVHDHIEVDEAREAVVELSGRLERNAAAMVWLTRIKEKDDYTAQHCLNVAILAMGVAHALEWPVEHVENAGLAGLLHDLGKLEIDRNILNKPGRLTEEEFEQVKRHTEYGYRMLKGDSNLPEEVCLAVLQHHERPDGRGYLSGLKHREISRLALLISLVDAYDAITSHRVYDPARSHHEALGILWRERGKQFDHDLVEAFIQFIGWVAPGNLVRLSSGQIAVVVEARFGQRLRPVVRKVIQEDGACRLGEQLDLAELAGHADGTPSLRIAEVLPDGHNGIDMRELAHEIVEAS